MMAMTCKNIITTIMLACAMLAANAQVYVTDFKSSKTQKALFSSYTLSYETYRIEDGEVYVEEFDFDIESPEQQAMDDISRKSIDEKIRQLISIESSSAAYEDLLRDYALFSCRTRYGENCVFGDSECQKFISEIKAKNSAAESDLFWEPSHYGLLTGKLIFQANMFVSYIMTAEECNAMTCLRNEQAFVYDIIGKRFLKESDFVNPQFLSGFSNLINSTITRNQLIDINKTSVDFNGNFFMDEYGLTYVFNSDKYIEQGAEVHVILDPKALRPMLLPESVVYKFYNIGQVERAKAKKQNKLITNK